MRVIKFRGQRIDNREWVFGSLVADADNNCCIIDYCDHSSDTYIWHPVETNSVGEFTGFKDKNNKEIYEGDVFDYGIGRVFYVSYVGCQFVATFSDRVINSLIPIYNFPIIGNIYENPELCK